MLPGLCPTLTPAFESWLWYQWLREGPYTDMILSASFNIGLHGFSTRHTRWGNTPSYLLTYYFLPSRCGILSHYTTNLHHKMQAYKSFKKNFLAVNRPQESSTWKLIIRHTTGPTINIVLTSPSSLQQYEQLKPEARKSILQFKGDPQ